MISFVRKVLCGLACMASFSLTGPAWAAYPERPIKLVVPWPPGGSADAVGRHLAFVLSNALGQSVYVENAAGASGSIGTASFARTQPDGYTLLLATSTTNAAVPGLMAKLPFHPVTDFSPISLSRRCMPPSEFQAFWKAEIERYRVKLSGAKAE